MGSFDAQGSTRGLEIAIADTEDADVIFGTGDQVGYDCAGLCFPSGSDDSAVDFDMIFRDRRGGFDMFPSDLNLT